MSRLHWLNLPGLLVILGLLLLWQAAIGLDIVNIPYVPTPTGILTGFKDLIDEGGVLSPIGHTLKAVLFGLLIAVGVGVLLGLAVGLIDGVWVWSMATIDTLRSVPGTALVPVMIVIFGLVTKAEVASAAFAAVWPVTVNTAGAVRQVHPRLRDSAATLRLNRFDTLRKIIVPAAAPVIMVGIRIGATITLVVVIVTEMIGNPQGMGYELISAQGALQPEQMWAWLTMIVVVGAGLNGLLVLASRWAGGAR